MTSPSTHIPDNPYIQIGLLVLIIISQIAQWVRKIKRSKCWGVEIEMTDSDESEPAETPRNGVIVK